MNKGIVMELGEHSIIVMNPQGRFDKIPRGTRSCEVGEEIIYTPAKRRLRIPQTAIVSGMVAAIVVCFVLVSTLTGGVASGTVAAYVTIDINPSVEIGIDKNEVVVDLHGLNSDGDQLIQGVTYKGKSLTIVTSDILDKAEQGALGKGEGDIVISSTVVNEKAKVSDEEIATKLKAQVAKHIETSHPDQVSNYEVTAFAAPQAIREQAQASGVSAGKYAIYLNAVDSGVDVSLDDLKSTSIHQLAKENSGIASIVKPEKPIDKSSLQRLLDDEKSGKLSEKMRETQEKRVATGSTPGKNDSQNGKGNGGNAQGKASVKPLPTLGNKWNEPTFGKGREGDSRNNRGNDNDRNNNGNSSKDNGKDNGKDNNNRGGNVGDDRNDNRFGSAGNDDRGGRGRAEETKKPSSTKAPTPT
ncbi:anti-sigma factor domain-containing protein, partial [Paenibacillus whitsoniae]